MRNIILIITTLFLIGCSENPINPIKTESDKPVNTNGQVLFTCSYGIIPQCFDVEIGTFEIIYNKVYRLKTLDSTFNGRPYVFSSAILLTQNKVKLRINGGIYLVSQPNATNINLTPNTEYDFEFLQ